ncbi:MAG: beta-galactosidase, partial [Thermoguttaceae bacterium]|nr:beta-galactosidase [Thermoguttaceae bacterium]
MTGHRYATVLLLCILAGTAYGKAPERFDIASEPIETPHVPWARPLPDGPVRALCLVPIPSQRDVVELAQRLDLEYTLVAFEHPLMDADAAREFGGHLAGGSFDVILLSKVPLAALPEESQQLLVTKVREGTGVINVHSAGTMTTSDILNVSDAGAPLTTALPLHLVPGEARPEVFIGRAGRGRCVRFAYPGRVACFTPDVDFEQVSYRDWETYYQLLARAVLWAAGREPAVTIQSVWPSPTVNRKPADPWRMEEVVQILQPTLDRQRGRWRVESAEETRPLPTWRGYGAIVSPDNGQLRITERNARATWGFAAGTFEVDLARTPIVEVAISRASRWSLFVPDAHFGRALATLQEETAETGTKRFDLREFDAIGGPEPLTLCFSTHGDGTMLLLDSLRFLTPDGEPAVDHAETASLPKSDGITLRLQAGAPTSAKVTAIYRGYDHYDPVDQREQQVAIESSQSVDVVFPLIGIAAGRPHTVDLIVRDEQGRSLGFATAGYEVASPVRMESWEAGQEYYRRGDRAVLVATVDNQAGPRKVQVDVELADMYKRLVAVESRELTIPAGASRHEFSMPTDKCLTTLNRARLSIHDETRLLCQADAYVSLPEPTPAWDDYLVSTSQFSPCSAYLRPYVSRIAREMGIEGMVIPPRYTREVLEQAAPVMYWGAADVRAFGYNFRGTETSTERRPCLSDPETRGRISASYEELGEAMKPIGPLAIASLEDESELSGARYSNLEVCTSEHCTERYRRWLAGRYETIGALNGHWSTSYGSFDEIEPMPFEQARRCDNPAPWVEWRTFMEHVWLDALLLTRRGVKQHYPEVRMGFSNTFGQMPFSGWNFETLSRHVDMTIEYPTVIFRLTPPKDGDAFEADVLPMSTAIRQKLDIRLSFMPEGSPAPGWLWYDRSRQGAEFKPWWMAFLGAKGCTPWGPTSLGVRSGTTRMDYWAFIHPLLAHTKSSLWFAEGVGDLTRGVGKIFVDYQRAVPSVAVLYSQPSMHMAWAWSDVDNAFDPKTDSLYAWYYKSRVNVTRMLRELGLSYRYVGTSQIEAGELSRYRALFLPCSLCLSDETLKQIHAFVENGGMVIADVGAGAADARGKPLGQRELVEHLFGVSRAAVCRRVEPRALTATADGKMAIPQGLRLAGGDTATAHAAANAADAQQSPAVILRSLGRGRAVYLNGFLGYNLQSRQLMRDLLALAEVSTPVRITAGGREHMGYEHTPFSRGDIEVLGILRLRDEEQPTRVELGRAVHLYDVRNGKYHGLTDAAEFDLTDKAAAVLAILPYQVTGIELQAAPERVQAGGEVAVTAGVKIAEGDPGDHVLRVEVYDPTGNVSRAYTDNVLAEAGRWEGTVPTALNDLPGTWRIVVHDVISGNRGEVAFEIGRS